MKGSAIVESESNVDAIEEFRLRTWARRNYTPAQERRSDWHPVVHDEMRRKDREPR